MSTTAARPLPLRLPGVTPWPADLAERYRRAGWWQGVTLPELLDRWAERSGDAVAVTAGEETVTYTELAQRSRRLAGALHAEGIHRGDRVVIHLPNILGFLDATFALLRIGALPVMALPAHREHEIRYLVEHSEAVALAVPHAYRGFDYLEMARGIRDRCATLRHLLVSGGDAQDAVSLDAPAAAGDCGEGPVPSDTALFLLSGGTTGLPKLIPRTHDDYAYNACASAELCGFDAHTVYLAALPVSHNFPLACPGILGALAAGGRVVLTTDPSPEAAFALIERERVTATALVPTLAIRWCECELRERHDLSSLQLLQVGGARLAPEAARRVRPALGARLQQVFGMAEGLLNYTHLADPDDVIIETQGRPLCPDDELRIVDALGNPVAPGEIGELLTRGPYTLRGYYKADEHNRRAFTDDGFYRSGDIVRLHPTGNLVVEGRAKDLINRGGEKISAEEVEDLVLRHPAVFNVAAVAMPDRELGERTCIYVVPRRGRTVTLEEICALLAQRCVAKFKFPERLELVDELPLTKVGKVDKRALREDVARKLAAEEVRHGQAG